MSSHRRSRICGPGLVKGLDDPFVEEYTTSPTPIRQGRCPRPRFELGAPPEDSSDFKPSSPVLPDKGDRYWVQKTAVETGFTALGEMAKSEVHQPTPKDSSSKSNGSQAINGLGDGLSALVIGANTRLDSRDKSDEACPSPVFPMDLEETRAPRQTNHITNEQAHTLLQPHHSIIPIQKLNAAAAEFKPAPVLIKGSNLDANGHMKPTRVQPGRYSEYEARHRQSSGSHDAAVKSFTDAQDLRDQDAKKAHEQANMAMLSRLGRLSDQLTSHASDDEYTESSKSLIMQTIISYPVDSPPPSSRAYIKSWAKTTDASGAYTHDTAFGHTTDDHLYPEPLNIPRRMAPLQEHAMTAYYAPPRQQYVGYQSDDYITQRLHSNDSFFGTSSQANYHW